MPKLGVRDFDVIPGAKARLWFTYVEDGAPVDLTDSAIILTARLDKINPMAVMTLEGQSKKPKTGAFYFDIPYDVSIALAGKDLAYDVSFMHGKAPDSVVFINLVQGTISIQPELA